MDVWPIPKDSLVVFDLDDKEFVDRQIYVVNRPESNLDLAAAKRVRKMREGLSLVSDNPSDPLDPVVDMDWNELVVGKTVWMWRSLLGA